MANKGRNNKKRSNNFHDFIEHDDVRAIASNLNGEPTTPKEKARKIIGKRLQSITFRTPNQKKYYKVLKENEITICAGEAGTGKSFVSVYTALELLISPDNKYEKVYIITPAVEAEEKLGFLPGNVKEKLAEYIDSTLYIMEKLLGEDTVKKLVDEKLIEAKGLGFIRGKTFDNVIILFEESQNATIKQMKTFLSRIGEDAKFFVSGDVKQSDRGKKKEDTGLYFAMEYLQNLPGLGHFQFEASDIVRNKIIGQILAVFEQHGK